MAQLANAVDLKNGLVSSRHPVFEGTLYRIQMRELQSQGIHPLALSCKGLMKVRTMWTTVNPLQAPLDVRLEIQGIFVSSDEWNIKVE